MSVPAYVKQLVAEVAERERQRLLALPMPEWPDYVRAYPIALLRCSLFGIHSDFVARTSAHREQKDEKKKRARGLRRYVTQMPVTRTKDGIAMWYEGQLLGQRDFDILAWLAHRARGFSYNQPIEFTLYSLFRELGWAFANDHAWATTRLLAMTNAQVFILNKLTNKRESQGHLLRKAVVATDPHATNAFTLGPYVHQLYTKGEFTTIAWDARQKMKDHPLAQWLQLFYASHVPGRPYRVSLLAQLAGLRVPERNDARYKQKLRELRHRIVAAHKLLAAHKFIHMHTLRRAASYRENFEYCIGAIREPTLSQQPYLDEGSHP